MSEYFYFNSNGKDIKKLKEYLRALAENPKSGVCILNLDNKQIQELRNKLLNEITEEYIQRQMYNAANANDVIIFKDKIKSIYIFRHCSK